MSQVFPAILAQFSHYLVEFCSKVMPSRTLETLPIPITKYKDAVKNTEKPPIASTNTTLYLAHLQSFDKQSIHVERGRAKWFHGNFFLMPFHGTMIFFRPISFWWVPENPSPNRKTSVFYPCDHFPVTIFVAPQSNPRHRKHPSKENKWPSEKAVATLSPALIS